MLPLFLQVLLPVAVVRRVLLRAVISAGGGQVGLFNIRYLSNILVLQVFLNVFVDLGATSSFHLSTETSVKFIS